MCCRILFYFILLSVQNSGGRSSSFNADQQTTPSNVWTGPPAPQGNGYLWNDYKCGEGCDAKYYSPASSYRKTHATAAFPVASFVGGRL